jgi:hypothetical protein
VYIEDTGKMTFKVIVTRRVPQEAITLLKDAK